MKSSRYFAIFIVLCAGFRIFASENDSAAIQVPDAIPTPAAAAVADSIAVPDTLAAFSVLQKKYLKTSIITNVLYTGGFGLLYGVVFPRMSKVEDGNTMGILKLLPLEYLAMGMMYASVPVSVVSSHRAKKNYEYYYKTAPRNITLPLTFASAGLHVGSVGVSIWNGIADYRDNHEIDQSYNKYAKLTVNLFTAGLITFAGTNLYALVYTVILGKKAEQRSAASVHLSPLRYGDADGCLITWDF